MACPQPVTVFLAAAVIGLFESTIAKVVALAAFLPVVAGQGGIGGTQTVTLVVRSLATGDLPLGVGRRILRREIILGLIHGVVLGAIIGAVGWLWEGNPILGAVLALAMTGNMVVASIAGAGVPLILRRFKDGSCGVCRRVRHHLHRRDRLRTVPGARCPVHRISGLIVTPLRGITTIPH